jgi:hypothetical protein
MTFIKHISFSAVNILTFAKMGIQQPMEWRCDGETEAEKYGSATLPGALTVEDTKEKDLMFSNICRLMCVLTPFLFVGKLLIVPQSEAGCHILINTLLIHVTSNLETDTSGVVIAPEFRVDDTLLASTEISFGGVVDYMLIYGDRRVRGDSVCTTAARPSV